MAAISTSDIRNGITIKLDDGLFTVIEFQHVKPGKGGAFVRTKLRNARSGAVIERTYRSDERLEQAMMDKRDTQYLYRDGDDYIFMDQSTYDQVPVSSKSLGEAANFLKETGKAMLILHDDEIIGVELPASVELTIADRASRATAFRARANRRRWRPGSSSRSPCSSDPANSSRSTRAPVNT
jgi:elongation factor P